MTIIRCLALVAAISLIAGCSAVGGGASGSPSASPRQGEPSVFRPTPGTGASAGPIDLPATTIDPVVADAASRAGVTPADVTVISAESVTFPDGGLGCPQPGMAYTQVVVDGYKIVVQANGMTFDYRGTGPTFRLCSQAVS